jgi:hypothetical protein
MKAKLWAGRIITGLTVLFLIFDAVTKIMQVSQVKEGMATLGYPASLTVPIGILLLVCTAFYVIPATSVMGAVADRLPWRRHRLNGAGQCSGPSLFIPGGFRRLRLAWALFA